MRRIVTCLALIAALSGAAWKWPPEVRMVHRPPPPANVGGITFVGEMVVFSQPLAAFGDSRPAVDSFIVEFPDTDRALCVLIAGGAPLPLVTVRDLKIPPWVPGNDPKLGLPTPPALPGVAWRAFEYEADTLVMWGYDASDSQYVGRLKVRTNIPVRPDSNAVFDGYWHSFGKAVPIKHIDSIPEVKKIRQYYAKQVDRYAMRASR